MTEPTRRATTLADAFWRHVTPLDTHLCWIWQGPLDKDGYGVVRFRTHSYKAHRLAYLLHHAPLLPLTLYVCHNCPEGDQRACCNPAHLFVGTQKDNMADASRKGRMRKNSSMASVKLTEDAVQQIIALRHQHTQKVLATMFHVSDTTINAILRGKEWKHIDPSYIPNPHQYSQKGEGHHLAKMTPDLVRQIRLWAQTRSMLSIANQLEVDHSTISAIVKRQTWKHIP